MPRNDPFTLLPVDDDRCIAEAVVRLEREFAGAVLRPAITEVVAGPTRTSTAPIRPRCRSSSSAWPASACCRGAR